MIGFDVFIGYGVEIVGGIAGLAASWALKRGADWFGVKKDSEMYLWVENQVDKALAQAEKRARDRGVSLSTGSPVADEAIQTVLDNSPKYMKKLGLGRQDVKRMLEERL